MIEIPPGTVLYRGVDTRKISDTDMGLNYNGRWFATLSTAKLYAFASNKASGEYGKVISYVTEHPVYVLDMESERNCETLYARGLAASLPETLRGENVLTYAFGYDPAKPGTLKRYSHPGIDVELAGWLCNQNLDGIKGWGYYKLPRFHEELMPYRPAGYLRRLPLEYRYSGKYDRAIIKTYNVEVVGASLANEDTVMGGRVKGVGNAYKPDRQRRSDRWLLESFPTAAEAKYATLPETG